MPTFSELWKEASKKYKPQIKDRDYYLIVVASAVSAGVSFIASKADWSKASFTKIFLIDFVLGLLGIAVLIFVIILLLFWVIRILNISWEFCLLVWKKWSFTER